MLLLPPLNCLLGVLCGTYFRVFIVLPLIALAVLEAAAVGIIETGSWIAIVNSLVLMACIEIGYLIGAAFVFLFPVFRSSKRPAPRAIPQAARNDASIVRLR